MGQARSVGLWGVRLSVPDRWRRTPTDRMLTAPALSKEKGVGAPGIEIARSLID
jgi:hypothetical protein